jgi:hypothetical protein
VTTPASGVCAHRIAHPVLQPIPGVGSWANFVRAWLCAQRTEKVRPNHGLGGACPDQQ